MPQIGTDGSAERQPWFCVINPLSNVPLFLKFHVVPGTGCRCDANGAFGGLPPPATTSAATSREFSPQCSVESERMNCNVASMVPSLLFHCAEAS